MTHRFRCTDQLARDIETYQARRAAGQAQATQHEELFSRIEHESGHVAAEFFDKERTLPPVTWGAIPWPMTWLQYGNFQRTRIGVTAVGAFIGLIGTAQLFQLGPLPSIVTTLVLGALAATAFTVIPHVVPPKNIETRRRRAQLYEAMVINDQDKAEQEAAAQRVNRLLDEYENPDEQKE